MLHARTETVPRLLVHSPAVDFGASRFLCRYAEEHIQKTGVAIETQGFTFITSGRKRESLTVRTLGDCRGSLRCLLCIFFFVLLVLAYKIMLLSFLWYWKWSHNTPSDGCDASSVNLHWSPAPPHWLVILCAAAAWHRCKDAGALCCVWNALGDACIFFLPLYLPLCRSSPVLLW